MTYVYLNSNKEVVKTGSIPKSTATVSNFYLLSAEDKKKHGWYEVQNQMPIKEEWQKYGPVEIKYDEDSDEVVKTAKVENIGLDNYKAVKLRELSSNATAEILRVAPEYKQRNAAMGLYEAEKVEQIKADVQKVRTEHDAKEAQILSANSYAKVSEVYTTIVAFVDPSKLDENGRIIPEEIELI